MSRAILTAFLIGIAVPALADEPKVSIAIRDDGFAPAEVQVPAGTKIELSIKNEQKSAAEFESQALRREKVIPPGATATVYVGPLQPGRYEFFDDFQSEQPRLSGREVGKRGDAGDGDHRFSRGSRSGADRRHRAGGEPRHRASRRLDRRRHRRRGRRRDVRRRRRRHDPAAVAGMGQELFNAAILLAAVAMLGWHNIWMTRHGREMALAANRLGSEVREGARPLWALALVVGLAVLREGSEVVLFLYGIAATAEGAGGMALGGALGLAGGATAGAALYYGLVSIPLRHLFAVTGWMILLLAAGMAAQAAAFLTQADLLPPLGNELWDTSFLLTDDSLVGKVAAHADRLYGAALRHPGRVLCGGADRDRGADAHRQAAARPRTARRRTPVSASHRLQPGRIAADAASHKIHNRTGSGSIAL